MTTTSIASPVQPLTNQASHSALAGGPARRTAAAVIALAGLAVLAACSGGGSANPGVANLGSSVASASSSTSSASNGALAYSRCMRSRGISNFPDPDSRGSIPKETAQQLGISNSQYQAATGACADLLPNSDTGGLSQAQVQQEWNGMRNFAGCMRSHGVSNWPDPADDGNGGPVFYLQHKIDVRAPQIVTKINACLHLIPADGRSASGAPGGVSICPGDKPNPATQRGACG